MIETLRLKNVVIFIQTVLKNTINHFWKTNKKIGEKINNQIVTQQPKTLENQNIFDIKSVTIQHPKISHKLSKTIRQAKMISQLDAGKSFNKPLYSKIIKSEKLLNEKKASS